MAIIIDGERIVVEKTYAQMAALIAAEELNPFLWYKITDRGDRGLVFRAAAVDRLESTGIRYMLCPATYEYDTTDSNDNHWMGVWYDGINELLIAGDLIIWNALVYTTGELLSGDSPDTEGSGFTVVPKASFTNGEYVELIFNVYYDFKNDWISSQDSVDGIILGIPKARVDDFYGEEINPVDLCDWNYATSGFRFYNNKGGVILNNHDCDIMDNSNFDFIQGNNKMVRGNFECKEILDNKSTIQANVSCFSISGNGENIDIQKNQLCDNINNNTNVSGSPISIKNNRNCGTITGTWDADVTDAVVDKTGTAE